MILNTTDEIRISLGIDTVEKCDELFAMVKEDQLLKCSIRVRNWDVCLEGQESCTETN